MEYVLRYSKPLDIDHLHAVLEGGSWPAEQLPQQLELDPVADAIAQLSATLSGSELDGALVEPLHLALKPMSRRTAADMRVWHWLTVTFQDHVWRRWKGSTPEPGSMEAFLGVALSKRFLGKSSLNGVSRNTFARLWWTAEQLVVDGDYELARAALANQDAFQAIFERSFGIYRPASTACLARFSGSEIERRATARWLQQCLSTTVLECLSEEDILAVLDEPAF